MKRLLRKISGDELNKKVTTEVEDDLTCDLSNKELTSIPWKTFTRCKERGMEVLLLHSNRLKSIKCRDSFKQSCGIKNLHSNMIGKLPAKINLLENLEILNVSQNQLFVLPREICQLKKLHTLNARDNNLNSLPYNIEELSSLVTLDISGTNQIFYLSKSLAHVRTLQTLNLPKVHLMEYPSALVCEQGTEEIEKILCRDVGIEYIGPSPGEMGNLSDLKSTAQSDDLEKAFFKHEQEKKAKERELQRLEQQIADSRKAEKKRTAAVLGARKQNTDMVKKESERLSELHKKQQEQVNLKQKKITEELEGGGIY